VGVAEWVAAAAIKDLQRRKKTQVQVGGQPVALFLVGGRVFALHDTCIHEERSLSKGAILRGRVVCPGHQWQFDLDTGWVEDQEKCQPTYDVKVEDDTVYINPERRIRIPSSADGGPNEASAGAGDPPVGSMIGTQ
jgi:nitrite reductase (NADH) small subunit